MAEVDRKIATPPPPPPSLRPQKRKADGSIVGYAPAAKGPRLDYGAYGSPRTYGSDYFRQPFDVNHKQLADGLSHTHAMTPKTYAHGPRSDSQMGSLIGYNTHAAMLRGKLAAVKVDMKLMRAKYEEAITDVDRAEYRLREHARDQQRFFWVEGDSRRTREVWGRRRDQLSRQLDAAERSIQRVRDEMKKRRLPPLDAEEMDANGWAKKRSGKR